MWKILIIDDNRIDREIYKVCLGASMTDGFGFAETDFGAAGIEMSKSWEPDCILLDFHLPDITGLDVLTRLRGEDDRLPCAVLMLTAGGGEEVEVRARNGGAMDFLPKRLVSPEVLPYRVLRAIRSFQMLVRRPQQEGVLEGSRAWF